MREDEALRRLFLFREMPEEELESAMAMCEPRRVEYHRGDVLCAPDAPPRAIILLLEGECDVRNGGATLNTLGPGSCFGVLSLFAQGDFPSTVIARKHTGALLLPGDAVERMLLAYPRAAVALAVFLSNRVAFLNRRIGLLTEPSVLKRLAMWLLEEYRRLGATFPLNRRHTAQLLGCGRASLYRALEELQRRDILRVDAGSVTLLQAEELERMLN